MKIKRAILGGIVIILVIIAVLLGLSLFREETPNFRTETVKKGSVSRTVDAVGTASRGPLLDLAFPVSGSIEAINVKVGDRVEAGTVLAALHDDEYATGLASAQANVDRALAEERAVIAFGASANERASAQAAVNAARAEHQAAILRMRSTVLESPVAGVVTAIRMNEHEFIGGGQSLVTVEAASDVIELALFVRETDVTDITVGQQAEVMFDAFEEVEFAGNVTAIYPAATEAEGAPLFEVHVVIPFAEGKGDALTRIRSGMTADAQIVVAERNDVLLIPQRAIITKDGKRFVRAPDDAAVEGYAEREIQTDVRGDNGQVIVASGLEEGETFVLSLETEE